MPLNAADSIDPRPTSPRDAGAMERLYPAAFPDEDLLPLVRELLNEATSTPSAVTSFVAERHTEIVGHIAFTRCGVSGHDVVMSLLGPLAVAPASQRQGIGGALIRHGLERAGATGACLVCVLGDPAYYGRFGFRAERRITPPFPLPPEWDGAWQSRAPDTAPDIPVSDSLSGGLDGSLIVPPVWNRRELWVP